MSLCQLPGGKDPKRRLSSMVIALVAIAMGMGYLFDFGSPRKGNDREGADKQVMKAAAEGATAGDPLPDVFVSETLEKQNILDFVSADDENIHRASDLSRIRPAMRDAFSWLKGQSHEAMAEKAWHRGRWSYEKVMQYPDNWRFQICHVYGMLMHYELLELKDMPAGLGKLHKLILIDIRRNQSYTVLTPLMPKEAKAMAGTSAGSYLACDGLFVMRFPYLSNSGMKRTPLFLAKRTWLSREAVTVKSRLDMRGDPGIEYKSIAPKETVAELDLPFVERNVYAPPKDGKGFRYPGADDYHHIAGNIREDKPALEHIFSYVYGLSDATLQSQVNPEISFATLLQGTAAPSWMRGKITRFRGLVGHVKTETFSDDGLPRIHLIVGHDLRIARPDATWALAVLNLPENLKEDDEVEAEGVFVKLWPYKTPENKWHWSPLIVCKSVRVVERAETGDATPTYIVIAVVTLALLLLMYWASNRDTKDLTALRQRSLERRIKHDQEKARQKAQEKETTESEANNEDATD